MELEQAKAVVRTPQRGCATTIQGSDTAEGRRDKKTRVRKKAAQRVGTLKATLNRLQDQLKAQRERHC